MKKRLMLLLLVCLMAASMIPGAVFKASAADEPEIVLPPVLIKGFTYSLPALQNENGEAVIQVNGEPCGSSFVADGTQAVITYADSASAEEVLASYTLPVVDTADAADHCAYFYDPSGVIKAEETADQIVLSFSKDGTTTFANVLSANAFALNMEFVEDATNFASIALVLTDAQNPDVSLTLTVEPIAQVVSYGEQSAEVGMSSGMLQLKYSNLARCVQNSADGATLFTIETDDNGNEFEGFSGGVYLTFQIQNVTGSSKLYLNRLNNQPLGHRDSDVIDQTEPMLNLTSKIETKQYMGELFAVPAFAAYDVLSEVTSCKVIVTTPSGNDVFSGAWEDYTPFTIEEYGRYKITYRAEDSHGNVGKLTKTVFVNDDVAPVLEVGSLEKDSYAKGDAVTIPAYTVSDNLDVYFVDVILILPNSEIRLLTHDDNGQVTSYIGNTDLYNSSFRAGDNAFKAEQSGTYTLRFVAYDDVYNRTVVEVPFEVK